jgi:hypothetical protein
MLECTFSSRHMDSNTFPGALFDVFCRFGGATIGHRDVIAVHTMMLTIFGFGE